LKKNEF
jgi:hypothetical protein